MASTRREALAALLALSADAATAVETPSGSLTDVPGVQVGHWTSSKRPTGCTAILTPGGATAGVDVRGGGPGTRETDLLRPEASIQQVHGICLAGGSAYGLAAADGVMRFLEEQGAGFAAGRWVVPIVPAAILFDLNVGDGAVRPDAKAGYRAAKAATKGPVEQGNVGAGAGATVGKLFGAERSMKGGLGSASLRVGELVVGALAAVNAIGDVVDPKTGEILAGALEPNHSGFADSAAYVRQGLRSAAEPASPAAPNQNTTLGVVAANLNWTQAQATKCAQMAHDGFARAIRPVHMPFDGDVVFALGTGGEETDLRLLGVVGALAADALALAVTAAVMHARSIPGRPARRDLSFVQ